MKKKDLKNYILARILRAVFLKINLFLKIKFIFKNKLIFLFLF